MKVHLPDRVLLSTLILISLSCILTCIVLMTDRQDLTSASVVISALILFLTGIFLFTFTQKESLDGKIVSLLPVQGTINLCRIAADLGIMGNSWFLPGNHTGESEVMQFLPVSHYQGGTVEATNTFVSGPEGTGILIPASGVILLSELKTRNRFVIPESREELRACIREIGEDFLEVADRVEATDNDDTVVIILRNYRLIDGCLRISQESPACCTLNPCPICSLFAMILAEGGKKPVCVDRCRHDHAKGVVTIVYTIMG